MTISRSLSAASVKQMAMLRKKLRASSCRWSKANRIHLPTLEYSITTRSRQNDELELLAGVADFVQLLVGDYGRQCFDAVRQIVDSVKRLQLAAKDRNLCRRADRDPDSSMLRSL